MFWCLWVVLWFAYVQICHPLPSLFSLFCYKLISSLRWRRYRNLKRLRPCIHKVSHHHITCYSPEALKASLLPSLGSSVVNSRLQGTPPRQKCKEFTMCTEHVLVWVSNYISNRIFYLLHHPSIPSSPSSKPPLSPYFHCWCPKQPRHLDSNWIKPPSYLTGCNQI